MKALIFGLLAIPLTLIAAVTVKAAGNLEKATLAGVDILDICNEAAYDPDTAPKTIELVSSLVRKGVIIAACVGWRDCNYALCPSPCG